MKKVKFILSIAAVAATNVVLAQGNPLTNAILSKRNGNMDKARSYVEEAYAREENLKSAKFWFTRGDIYYTIGTNDDAKIKALGGDSANVVMYKSFQKVLETDKEKGEFRTEVIKRKPAIYAALFNGAIPFFNEKKFAEAYQHFMLAAEVDPKDTNTFNNAFVAALQSEEMGKAENVLTKMEAAKHKVNMVNYYSIASYYERKDDTKNLLAFVIRMREKFPKDPTFVRVLVKTYVDQKDFTKAKPVVEELLKLEPQNAFFWNLLGSLNENEARDEDEKKNFATGWKLRDIAVGHYDKAIAIDSTNLDYNFRAGAIYFNRGKFTLDSADDQNNKYIRARAKNPKLPKPAIISNMEKRADSYFRSAKTYLERAYRHDKGNPKDEQVMNALLSIYGRLKDQKGFAVIEAEMKKQGMGK